MPAAAAYANCRERLIDALSLIHRQLADDTYASGTEHALEPPAPPAPPAELPETPHPHHQPSTVARLLDLGVEPFLITATVEGVVAQRLVRKICTKCRTEYEPDDDQLFELRLDRDQIKDKTLYYGKGCNRCNNTGYKGRLGLYEIMTFNDTIRNMIMEKASTNLLRDEAVKNGMTLLRTNGLSAIYDGITTMDEVIKQTVAGTE